MGNKASGKSPSFENAVLDKRSTTAFCIDDSIGSPKAGSRRGVAAGPCETLALEGDREGITALGAPMLLVGGAPLLAAGDPLMPAVLVFADHEVLSAVNVRTAGDIAKQGIIELVVTCGVVSVMGLSVSFSSIGMEAQWALLLLATAPSRFLPNAVRLHLPYRIAALHGDQFAMQVVRSC